MWFLGTAFLFLRCLCQPGSECGQCSSSFSPLFLDSFFPLSPGPCALGMLSSPARFPGFFFFSLLPPSGTLRVSAQHRPVTAVRTSLVFCWQLELTPLKRLSPSSAFDFTCFPGQKGFGSLRTSDPSFFLFFPSNLRCVSGITKHRWIFRLLPVLPPGVLFFVQRRTGDSVCKWFSWFSFFFCWALVTHCTAWD